MSGNSQKVTLLLVEDEEDLRGLFAEGLTLFGADVIQAKDGQEGWDLYKANSKLVDAVVSDIFMPRMDGIELLNHVKKENPSLPVMLVTAYAHRHRAQLEKECLVPPDAFLEKPFHLSQLLSALKELLPGSFMSS